MSSPDNRLLNAVHSCLLVCVSTRDERQDGEKSLAEVHLDSPWRCRCHTVDGYESGVRKGGGEPIGAARQFYYIPTSCGRYSFALAYVNRSYRAMCIPENA
jgi:hypothetical protein